ncbi:hypothetical protein [Thiohalocapsa marina]|uniref:hypothetical protein n=1 Tax=Thiohalocapsa marina TaxID=424902 RepID=UPI0036DF7771
MVLTALPGCSGTAGRHDLSLLYARVEPIEYARILCASVDLQYLHTCLNQLMAHYRAVRQDRGRRDRDQDSSSTGNHGEGPLVAILGEDRYSGRYRTTLFTGRFTIDNGRRVCRGRYSAFAGDAEPVYRVTCDDGVRGTARLVLDTRGRDGIGALTLDDGSRADIVFGPALEGLPGVGLPGVGLAGGAQNTRLSMVRETTRNSTVMMPPARM